MEGEKPLYTKTRARVLVGVAIAAATWALVHRLPDRTEDGIAALLASESGVSVAPGDFVWEPSRGAFADLFSGRGVVFLGRAEAGAPRDVFRAKVHLTIGGQPLFGRKAGAITSTAFGDEEALEIVGGRAIYATRFQGKVQSIGVLELESGRSRRVALPAAADDVAREAAPDALVLALPSGPQAIDWDSGPTVTAGGVHWSEEGSTGVAPRALARPFDEAKPADAEVFPPAGARPLLGEEPSPIFELASGSGKILALDGRRLELHLVDGAEAPGTQTGWISGGSIPKALVGRGVVAAIELPAVRGAGSFKSGGWSALLAPGAPAIAVSDDGRFLVGPWPLDAWSAAGLTSANALETSSGSSGWALCATGAGHLLVGSGAFDGQGPEWSHCVAGASGEGSSSVIHQGEGVDWSKRPLAGATVVAVRSRYGPPMAAPSGEWAVLALGQPTPAWLPAIRAAKTTVLGASVEVTWIDPQRFDWTVRAGTEERSHRMGGDFPEKLSEADQARAKIAFGLGVGKRRSPRGLRVDGSTGHRFHGEGGLLLVGPGEVTLFGTDRPGGEPQDDGTELPVTLEDGELTTDARKRGPRQLRADLCVVPGGLLVAQATFDNHEATASVLRDMGCRLALALDRGSNRESWSTTERPGPFETTALIALDRPLKGRIGAMKELTEKSGQ